jgi:ribosome-associated protein
VKTPVFSKGCRLAARLADDKKGENILVFDVRHLTGVSNYFVLVGATSGPHMNALEAYLMVELKKKGFRPSREDGSRSDSWRVLDYGGFIVHIMRNEAREFYGLERLWEGAKRLHWVS